MINTLMRIEQLGLKNFRCFEDCGISLHPELTVLVAENGRGKTAVLDGIANALGVFVDGIAHTRQVPGFRRSDVRLMRSKSGTMDPSLPTKFTATGHIFGETASWSRSLNKYSARSRTSTKDSESIRQRAHEYSKRVDSPESSDDINQQILPLVAFYGTGRLWSEHRLTKGKRDFVAKNDRLRGYLDCLSSSSSFKGAVTWYENKMVEIGDPRFSTKVSRNLSLISAVQEATRVVLEPTGWGELDWDFEQRTLVVTHPIHGRLPLSALSDGVRNMIALVADIARRCAALNPHLSGEAAKKTPGILLIDEVDMHLHPRWQQLTIDLLRKAFPALQMILSTHSPHVLSTVDKSSIRIIRFSDGVCSIEIPNIQTRGVESADVLASVMGVDPIPQTDEAKKLSKYRALIEDGKTETPEAKALRTELSLHFGESHPVLVDCERLIRFQAFRLKRTLPEES